MTNQQHQRAIEIKEDIAVLKSALSNIGRSRFFPIEENTCVRSGSPFLSTLHAELQKTGIDKIYNEIEKLEAEFLEL